MWTSVPSARPNLVGRRPKAAERCPGAGYWSAKYCADVTKSPVGRTTADKAVPSNGDFAAGAKKPTPIADEEHPAGAASGTPSEDEFAAGAEEWLSAHAQLKPADRFVHGEGDDEVSILPERTPDEDAREVGAAMAWAQKVFDAGFGWITGPKRYGGRWSCLRRTSASTGRSKAATRRRARRHEPSGSG